jgi:DNA repair exonuclease SbcCD ATPase subunit
VKRLIVTDTHLGLYSDSDIWLDIVLNFYKHIVKYCIKNNITQLIHLGDFFNNRKSLNTKTQHTAHRIAKVLQLAKNLHTYIIVGNHDCYYKNQIHPNTLELFKEYGHITIVDEIKLLDDILLVPWGSVPDDTLGAKYCFGHFAINGFHMNDSYKCKDGLDAVKFKDFEKVLSGHFHTPSSNQNITYLGAPYGQTFHDVGGVRGYHTFEDGKLIFIEYGDAPRFIKIHINSGEFDESEIKGNIIKIMFDKDYGTTENQSIIDNILKHEPFLYSVNFTSLDDDESADDNESIEMDSKEKIVDTFIDNQTFASNIKIDTLKSMFKKIMKEAGEKAKIKIADGTKIECGSIGFQNFLSFGNRWQDIELKNGINFVTGIDKDKGKSNGAGKSSFLETIPFALFGKTARDIKQDQIVNWKNKKNCSVVFRFKINEDLYEIQRGLKPNKLLIFKNGDPLDQDAHKSDYQSMFEDIFGMDAKAFMSLIHSNVNSSANNIMSMKKAEKRAFLEKMFGLEVYSDMNKLCNDKLRDVEQKKYKIKTDMDSAKEKVESSLELQIKFNQEIKSKKSILDSVNEAQEKLDKLKEDHPNLDSDIENTTNEISNKREAFHKVTLEFETGKAKLDAEIEHLNKEISQIEDQEEQRKKNAELQGKIDAIEKKAGKIDEIQSKIEKLVSDEKELSKKFDDKFAEISDIDKKIVELETNLKNVEEVLKQLATGICPTCGQDVTDPKTHYGDEKTSIKKEISIKKDEVGKVKKEKQDILDDLTDIRNKKSVLDKAKDSLYNLNNQLKEVGSEEKKDALIKDKENKTKKIKEITESYNKKEKKHSNEINALKHKHEDLLREQAIINSSQKDLDLIKSQAKEANKHIDALKEMIKEQDMIIESSKNKIKTSESSQNKLNDIGDYLNAIKDILKDENIKQYTIKQIMPFMNKQTNHYLSEVNYGFYVVIDKWLDVEIKGPGIRNASYDSLSGGEKRGIDIAIQLSLIDIARIQKGIFPDLLVFDELLDSSIDSNGINELMKIVRFKQREFGGKVFIISHRDEIDGEMVDNLYNVVKENGYSIVETL